MMSHIIKALTAVAIAVAFTGNVFGGPIIIDNGSPDFVTGLPSDLDGGGFLLADNIAWGTDATITDLKWWGGFFSGAASIPGGTTFMVDLYADGGSGPTGAPLATSALTSLASTDTTMTVGVSSTPVLEIDGTLATPIAISGGTPYWLSIVSGVDGDIFGWVFSNSFAGDAHLNTVPPTAWSEITGETGDGAELAFVVFGVEDSVVPEPSSLALLGMGAFAFVGYGLRRRKQSEIVQ